MIRIEYFAEGKNGNLYQFRWSEDDKFFIKLDKKFIEKNANEYKIREIAFLTADVNIKLNTLNELSN